MNTYKRFDVVFDHGEKCFLYDINNKKYVDFAGGIAVSALGYSSLKLKEAIKNQTDKMLHCSNLYYSEPQIMLAQKLVQNSCFDKAFFCNSGAEANEAALKLAKKYAKKNKGAECFKFIAFKNSFHGRTTGALSLTGQEKYQKNFTPLMDGVEFADFNNIQSVKEKGSAITVSPAKETLIIVNDDKKIESVLTRDKSRIAKAPQSFYLHEILDIEEQAIATGKDNFVDSSTLMAFYGKKLFTVEGPYENIKITTPDDFYMFKALFDARENAQIFGI